MAKASKAERDDGYVNDVSVVNSFVKRGAAPVASGEARRAADAEAIGREQQRRAVAYGRSRGQL